MRFERGSKTVNKYKYVSSNQHGDRYKQVSYKPVPTVMLHAKYSDAGDLSKLIILGDFLKVPVKYDFNEQEAYIELMSTKGI